MFKALTALLAALCLAVAACGDDDDGDDSGEPSGSAQTQAQEESSGCKDVSAPAPKPNGGQQKPKGKLDPGKTYSVTMETSCGSFTFALDQKTSPNTAASFASLVKTGFFDGVIFHRIVPGFVIQSGDPTGTGTGGPGYSTRDVPPSDARYTLGVVAMAKGPEPPGTSGSQFYVVTGADIGLPPDFALLGKVTSGLDVVKLIDQQGDPATGQVGTPLKPVVIEKATLEES